MYTASIILFENENDITTMCRALQNVLDSDFGQNHSYMMDPYKNVLKKLSAPENNRYKQAKLPFEFQLISNEVECAHIALSKYHEIYFDDVSDKLMKDLARNIRNVHTPVRPIMTEEQHEAIIPFAVHTVEHVF